MIKDVSDTGGKKVFRKAAAYVVNERIEMVASMLAKGCDQRSIRLALKKAPHNLEWRQVANYVARARSWLLDSVARRTKSQALADALKFYDDVIADKKAPIRDRIVARQQLDAIFGLHAPRALAIREIQIPQTGADEMQRQENPSMERALELVYGSLELQRVIEIETKQLPTPEPNKKKKLALT